MALKEELESIVGSGGVLDAPETLAAYSKDESFVAPMMPEVVVKPRIADEVQAIVKWANQTATPLVPVSSGPPHFRGDTVPSVPGAVVVDLSGMKQIIKVDRRNKLAIIEPGVIWSELQSEAAKESMLIPMPLMPRRSKSVIGSLLEREPMITPKYHWTLLEPLRCCEVIWGCGDKMWTGEAGDQKGSLEERWGQFLLQVNPMGPYQTDYYRLVSAAQGSMGIVTCASLKCEIMPQIHKVFFVQSAKLEELIDFAYKVLRLRYGYELFIMNGANLASILAEGADQIKALKETLPPWILILGIAGLNRLPEERVRLQEKDIKDIALQDGQKLMTAIPGADGEQLLKILSQPSPDPYWKLRYKGGYNDVFFMTTLNRAPEFVNLMFSSSQSAGYSPSEINVYIQPTMQGVSCHCEFSLPFNPIDQNEVTRVKNLVTSGSKALMKQGAFFSRPYGSWADMVYSRDAQTTTVLKKVKGIFDPNSVMNPGKLCF
ncbi:FAD-binding oxidoreductase [Chloroflexota bacterium]